MDDRSRDVTDPPGWMFDMVFDAPAITLPCVAPVVLRDEFLMRTRRNARGFATRASLEAIPLAIDAPRVLDAIGVQRRRLWLNLMLHGNGEVRLVVRKASRDGDGPAGDVMRWRHSAGRNLTAADGSCGSGVRPGTR